MTIFDGYAFAARKEAELTTRAHEARAAGREAHIAAILFSEDSGSRLYTRLKSEAASRVGIGYSVFPFSMTDPIAKVIEQVEELNQNPRFTGIIIQKPWRARWIEVQTQSGRTSHDWAEQFRVWWLQLASALKLSKDVDGLHPQTLAAIKDNTWREKGLVLPATAKAVLDIMRQADLELAEAGQKPISPEAAYTILGRSDILGQPLFYELQNQDKRVEMIGSKELSQRIEQGIGLGDRDVIITATGRTKLITGDLLRPGSVVIDVGEPKPDLDRDSLTAQPANLQPAFITPVPGGVGPVTVVSLLENALDLA